MVGMQVAKWKRIAGNFSTVTERSFGVPDGVNTGNFGLGVVIDFFGFSSKASGFQLISTILQYLSSTS